MIRCPSNRHLCGRFLLLVANRRGLQLKTSRSSPRRDPYRLDTPAGHRDAKWFADQVERFVSGSSQIHVRGLHYAISSTGGVRKSNGDLYVNDDPDWVWLGEIAARAARWLGLHVIFHESSNQRNDPPQIFVPVFQPPAPWLSPGVPVVLPTPGENVMPHFFISSGIQCPTEIPHHSIRRENQPRACPATNRPGYRCRAAPAVPGEASDTMIAELAKRAGDDGRRAVVLYFSDFDPAGRQMAVSVSRKLQALRDLLYPELAIDLRPVALTLAQVTKLDLPSTPLKEKERRADRWRAVMGREQTEIDALATLRPDTLREIALEAIRPFYDAMLARRVVFAAHQWRIEADIRLAGHPDYESLAEAIGEAQIAVESSVEGYNKARDVAYDALSSVCPPPIVLPEPELPDTDDDAPPLFTTANNFVSATRRLKDHRALETEDF